MDTMEQVLLQKTSVEVEGTTSLWLCGAFSWTLLQQNKEGVEGGAEAQR